TGLHIRNAILFTQTLQPRLRLLVFQQREIGPEVMLDLVVEPGVAEVVEVTAGAVVHRPDHAAQIKLRAVGDGRFKAVEIVSRVTGPDYKERVYVREDFGHEAGEKHAQGRPPTQRQKKRRNEDESKQRVAEETLKPQGPTDRRERIERDQ